MKRYLVGEQEVSADILVKSGEIQVQLGEKCFVMQLEPKPDGGLVLVTASRRVSVAVAGDQVGIGGKVRRVVAQAVAGKKLEGGGGAFKAGSEPGTPPMPGVLVKYLVSEGEFLKSGAPIAVLSAMKMEHTIRAGKGGRVLKLLLNPGESVKKGQKLIELEEE